MVNKKQRNKILKTITLIAIIQIFLLISLPVCNGYLIGNVLNTEKESFEKSKTTEKNKESIGKKILQFARDFFSIKQIGIVSAQEEEPIPGDMWGCCVHPEEGGICEEIKKENCANPSKNWHPGDKCDEKNDNSEWIVPECSSGCCYDGNTGMCTPSTKIKCEEPGEFISCSSEKCQRGCCIVGPNAFWVTQENCQIRSGEWYGGVEDEAECHSKTYEEKWGACVYQDGDCDYVLGKDCNGEEFVEGKYCTDIPSEETFCEIPENPSRKCFLDINKNRVFQKDSCGNPAGVVEECDPGNEKCVDGQCKSISCEYDTNRNGNIESDEHYKHGESWCVFDSRIGEAKISEDGLKKVSADTPGSTHYLAHCVNGEVRINPTAVSGNRGKVCVNNDVTSGETDETFKQASREMNRQGYCLLSTVDYLRNVNERIEENNLKPSGDDNTDEIKEKRNKINKIKEEEKEILKEKCNSNMQCTFKEVDIAEGFKFPSCVGKYPHGNSCDIGTRTCKVMFERNFVGRWECENNCDCLKEEFIKKMSDHCMSLGDCGSSVNYIGEFSHNSDIDINPEKLNKFLACGGPNCNNNKEEGDPFHNKKVCGTHTSVCPQWKQEYGDNFMDDILQNRYSGLEDIFFDGGNEPVPSIAKEYDELGNESMAAEILGQKFSGTKKMGNLMVLTSGILGIAGLSGATTLFGATSASTIFSSATGSAILSSAPASSLAGPAVGAFLGAYIGAQIAKARGQGGGGAIMLMAGFSLLGLVIALEIIGSAVPVIGNAVAAVLAVVTAGWAWITGYGKTTTVEVQFKCNEWQAPAGVDENLCKKCNEKSLLDCTEYKCESIGQNCKFINKDTQNPLCVSIEDDGTAPVLSAGETPENYDLEKKEGRKFELTGPKEGNCIQEKSDLWFTIEADEAVQCKYSFEKPIGNYQQMDGNYPNDNDYLEKHRFSIEVPSLYELGGECTENEDGEITCTSLESGSNVNMYIKCQDVNGNFNIQEGYSVEMCVSEIPDLTAPALKGFSPEKGKKLKYNPKNLSLDVYTDEPAECKWGSSAMPYGEMPNKMGSSGEFEYSKGYLNSGEITGLMKGQNNYYIACNDTSGNIGKFEYNIEVLSSMNESEFIEEHGLQISSSSPESGKTISTNERPATVEIKVQTKEGINEGNAVCKYSFEKKSWSKMYDFEKSYDTVHTKDFNLMTQSGNYSVNVVCQGFPEGISRANTTINFTLDIDNKGPKIDYTFDSGKLTVTTDEPAKCSYSPKKCNEFSVKEGNEFDFGYNFVTEQKADWDPRWEGYSIKCIDELENTNCTQYGEVSVEPPEITRIFKSDGQLELNTDKYSKCYYAFDNCQFTEEEMKNNVMSGEFSKSHSTEWNSGTTYYIKCEDRWENWNDCIEVKPSTLTDL